MSDTHELPLNTKAHQINPSVSSNENGKILDTLSTDKLVDHYGVGKGGSSRGRRRTAVGTEGEMGKGGGGRGSGRGRGGGAGGRKTTVASAPVPGLKPGLETETELELEPSSAPSPSPSPAHSHRGANEEVTTTTTTSTPVKKSSRGRTQKKEKYEGCATGDIDTALPLDSHSQGSLPISVHESPSVHVSELKSKITNGRGKKANVSNREENPEKHGCLPDDIPTYHEKEGGISDTAVDTAATLATTSATKNSPKTAGVTRGKKNSYRNKQSNSVGNSNPSNNAKTKFVFDAYDATTRPSKTHTSVSDDENVIMRLNIRNTDGVGYEMTAPEEKDTTVQRTSPDFLPTGEIERRRLNENIDEDEPRAYDDMMNDSFMSKSTPRNIPFKTNDVSINSRLRDSCFPDTELAADSVWRNDLKYGNQRSEGCAETFITDNVHDNDNNSSSAHTNAMFPDAPVHNSDDPSNGIFVSQQQQRQSQQSVMADQGGDPTNPMLRKMKLLVEFEEKTRMNEWPSNTNIHCYWCCHRFRNHPYGIPVKYVNGKFFVTGCFCSMECAAAYNFGNGGSVDEMWDKYSLLNMLSHHLKQGFDENGKKEEYLVRQAPHRLALSMFGGPLSIEEFRNYCPSGKLTVLNFPPMMSLTQQIEEINDMDVRSTHRYVPIDNDRIDRYQKEIKLKRSKPLASKNNALVCAMNIRYTNG